MRKLVVASLATVAYLMLAGAAYYAHMRWFTVDVILYSALLDTTIAALALSVAMFMRRDGLFNVFEKTQLAAIWLLLGCTMAISLPTVIDRSLSFYILEKLQQRGGGIQLARFEDVFTKEYVKEHHLVDVRLTEQQKSGTVSIANGCVKLTERGYRLANFSRFFRSHFLPTRRLLAGHYTDSLVDPFRESKLAEGYQCK